MPVNEAYRAKVLAYWNLSRKWNGQDREPITFGELIEALNHLGDKCFNNHKLSDRVFDLLDRVERNWRQRKKKKTNNVVPLREAQSVGEAMQMGSWGMKVQPWQQGILKALEGKPHGTYTGRWASGPRMDMVPLSPAFKGVSRGVTGLRADTFIVADLSAIEERVLAHCAQQQQSEHNRDEDQ